MSKSKFKIQVRYEPPQTLAVTVAVPPEVVDDVEDEDVEEDVEDVEEDVEEEEEDVEEEDVEDEEEDVEVGTPIGPFSVVIDAADEVAEA
jgi:hypothetical protein